MNGTQLAKKYGISYSTTDYKEILKDQDVDTVFIVTRHNSHSKYVLESLDIKSTEDFNRIMDTLRYWMVYK